jgi:hypothetical protein
MALGIVAVGSKAEVMLSKFDVCSYPESTLIAVTGVSA